MRTLLVAINSKYIHSNLAVYSLKAYSEDCGMDIGIVEFTINQYTNFICKEIYKKKPDIVAFSCYIWNIDIVYEVSLELKKILPNIEIWLGGPEVTYDSESVLKMHPYIKGVMIGEGEETFSEVMTQYAKSGIENDFKLIKGISYHNKESLVITTEPRPLLDMDNLKFIYDDISEFENKIIYYESSRGCPFGCSYCLSSVEKSVRFRSISKVKEELHYFLKNKVSQVKFVDRTFNCNHERTEALLTFIRDNDNGITNFHFEIAADLLRDQEIEIMKTMRPGLVQLEIGVQSTNLETIHEIDRVMDFDKLSGLVEKINKGENIHQHLDLIAGLPYENYDSFGHSFNDVYKLRPEKLQLGFLKLLKGSKMHRKVKEYGIVYTEKSPYEVLFTNWISYVDVLRMKNVEEVVELYYNSGQYRHTMELLETKFNTPFEMYEVLADYYEDNNLFDIKHTRITRYNILLEFIKKRVGKEINVFEQVMVFDLYLRENLKTRPLFAIDISENKALFRDLYITYATNKNSHIEPFSIDIEKVCNINIQKYKKNGGRIDETSHSKNMFLLFDYEDRSPLNYEAKVSIIGT
ncbi:B12-binding domain-containing radical SAM protein [[Clostridium] fimetarium]|uniref:Radical SAM superfamily enzyme YgiQ, UPF0313 family n=1 Tax=[Clostridium] fimetarium TaxID=99656 RepID=A0A1I0M1N9_9FIRM|nr:B12-binding domain-containing radical SAM protein [[Clostridium] fimetarium]SEV82355.1 Radical SAM superfamily enzyme YgiQ, UPF0313 family [[Clostridium] fimetarium]